MPSGHTVNAAVPSTAKKPTTLAAALNGMHWDAALALVMASDPYYAYTPVPDRHTIQQKAEAKGHGRKDSPDTSAPHEHSFRRYVLSSSKTRLLLHASCAGYLLYVLTHPSRYLPCRVTASTAASPGVTVTDCYLYQAAEGMQLLVHGGIPTSVLLLHAGAGISLLPLAIMQKEMVFYMPFAHKTVATAAAEDEAAPAERPAEAKSEAKKQHLQCARVSRQYHGITGFLAGICVVVMVSGGVSLRSYSVFSNPAVSSRAGLVNFSTAMLLSAVPWVVLSPATTASGVKAKAAVHAMFGGVLIKAILAVPFARLLGGVCQRLAGVHVTLPPRRHWYSRDTAAMPEGGVPLEVTQGVEGELERMYYKSILATVLIFGAWAMVDVVRFVRLVKQSVVVADKATKSV